ncbi:hypothetical protein V1290_005610 [Bradyrhizobium sp. AZCC 1578]
MLMFKERRPTIRTLRGWAISVLQEPVQSANARSMVGCRTVSIRTPGSAASLLLVRINRQAFL